MTESNRNKSCCVQLEKTIFDTSVTVSQSDKKGLIMDFGYFYMTSVEKKYCLLISTSRNLIIIPN